MTHETQDTLNMFTRTANLRSACACVALLLALGVSTPAAKAQNLFEPEVIQPAAPAQRPVPPPTSTGKPGATAPAAPGPQGPASGTPEQPPAPALSPAPPSVSALGQGPAANPAATALEGFSTFVVTPLPPKRYAKHDLIEVIVNESSIQKFQQTSDNKKDYSLTGELSKFPSIKALIEAATIEEGIGSIKPGLGIKSNNKFKGEGKLDRKDQVTARITATVLDVKPNGTLVIEAKESIQTDREVSTMVLSGTARAEDITRSNTIQSGQLANLNIRIDHAGDVKDSSDKGLIPRVFEAIFNF